MTPHSVRRAAFVALLALACSLPTAFAKGRPNIILIMADDIGVEGIGSYGGASYRTPALDKLASQ